MITKRDLKDVLQQMKELNEKMDNNLERLREEKQNTEEMLKRLEDVNKTDKGE